jgi:hypothetical protein
VAESNLGHIAGMSVPGGFLGRVTRMPWVHASSHTSRRNETALTFISPEVHKRGFAPIDPSSNRCAPLVAAALRQAGSPMTGLRLCGNPRSGVLVQQLESAFN